ncbi:MAG: FlgD immunoglobulin-like domain containing protein, partial [Candidatus Eisenbacteria bacterium]|nr:FlgD immunoglobulin-like domain containing protein [Candidatus Eisenbacteria bacterium]
GPWTWPSTPELVADVQHWLDHPADNHGWIVIGNEATSATAKRFGSRHTFPLTARPWLTLTYTPVSAVPGDASAPAIALRAAPNPFRHATNVRFDLPHPALVGIQVFDLAGRLVRDLGREERPPGVHRLSWDGTSTNGRPVAHGVYVVRLMAGTHRQTVSVIRLP